MSAWVPRKPTPPLLIAAAVFLALPPARSATAQDQPAAAPSGELEEIVVVGQKRSQNIQKTAVAITAISGAALDQARVINPVDLNGQVPSLIITQSEGFNNSVAIRGIGFNVPQSDAAQPSVSYHIDGIYIANPVALDTGFLDVDHVEVLRGPQGTVFGQNSVGGTINVITKAPTPDGYTGFADIAVGTYATERFRAATNVPVSDTFALRGAIDQFRHDGYVNATRVPGTNGHYGLGAVDSVHARLSALWQPTDEFSALFRAEYADADNTETPFKNILDPDPDPWSQSSDWPGRFLYRQEVYSATLTWTMPWAQLKSLTSWQSVNQTGSVNEDGENLFLASKQGPSFYHDVEYFFHNSISITQEVDLSSLPGSDSPLDWIVGAFFLNMKQKVGYDQYAITPANPFYLNQLETRAEDGNFTNLYFQSASRLTRQSYSFYGQGTYRISDTLRLTGGARYTYDANATEIGNYFTTNPIRVHDDANNVTGKAEVDFDLTPDNMLYASFSTGFKPGGGNISDAPMIIEFQFKPETIAAYEIGAKNGFLDNKIRFNTATFYYDYSNMQFEAEDMATFEGGVANIPSAAVYGWESELSFLLPYNLRFDTNFTIEGSRITSHYRALDNVAGLDAIAAARADGVYLDQMFPTRRKDGTYSYTAAQYAAFRKYRGPAYSDVYGNSVPMVPGATLTAALSDTLDFDDGSSLLSRVQMQYRGSYGNAVFESSPVYTVPSYVLWSLYLDYTLPNDQWHASMAIDNLTNEAAVISKFTNQFGGETTQNYAPPRQFVFRVGYKF